MKTTLPKIILSSVFLITFNLIFFLVNTDISKADWCSYGFISFAYLCLITTPLITKGYNSTVLKGTIWLNNISFFFVEFVVGLFFLFIDPQSITWPLVIQILLTAVFIVLQSASMLVNETTTASLQKQKDESLHKQLLIEQLRLSLYKIDDKNIKPILDKCYDALYNSPIQSFPEAAEVENELNDAVNNLCKCIDGGGNSEQIKTAADAVIYTVQKRNLVIKRCRIN